MVGARVARRLLDLLGVGIQPCCSADAGGLPIWYFNLAGRWELTGCGGSALLEAGGSLYLVV